MNNKTTAIISAALSLLLIACGGDGGDAGPAKADALPNKKLAPAFAARGMAWSDTATLTGNIANYTVTRTSTGYTVTDNVGGTATQTYPSSILRFIFADGGLAFDIDGNAGKAYRLYQAAFDRAPDLPGLGYWIDILDQGHDFYVVAYTFFTSDEFKTLYGSNTSHADLITLLYQNVLHRTPDQEGFDYWLNLLNTSQVSPIQVLVEFSESVENKAQVLNTIQNGISYTPWGITQASLVPGAPAIISATAGNGSAAIAFSPPSSSGGAVIAYTASCSGGGISVAASGTGSPVNVSGMSNGTTHTCFVTAINSFGAGAASTSLNVTPNAPVASTLAACPADMSTPFFNTSPVALNDFIAFRPLGFLSLPIHIFPAKHSAFSMTPIGQTAVAKPVVAPGRVFVTEIYEASFSSGSKNYQVFLRPCQEVRAYFGHLASISDKLLTEFNSQAPNCNSFNDGSSTVTTCRRENLAIQLEEGEQFGSGPDTSGVDFGILDFRRPPAAFINAAHYDSYYRYYTSPLDYFSASTKSLIESKTGNVFGTRMRTALPIGGTYMEDLAGTAQGNWFLPGKYHSNTTDLSIFLGLVHDYVDPTQPIIAMGSSVPGMSSGLYSFTVQTTGLVNRDFSDVKADGQTYCFDSFSSGQSAGSLPLRTASGIVLMSMPAADSLKLEFVAGSSCSAVANWTFTANATTFER